MLTEHELDQLYAWVDGIPLSRPKKHMARDFSDGLLTAEIIHHFQPKLIDLHNFFDANSVQAKLKQWKLLETKAFKKLDLQVIMTSHSPVMIEHAYEKSQQRYSKKYGKMMNL